MNGFLSWWDGVELWLSGLPFVAQTVIVMPVVLLLAYGIAVLLDGALGNGIKLLQRARQHRAGPIMNGMPRSRVTLILLLLVLLVVVMWFLIKPLNIRWEETSVTLPPCTQRPAALRATSWPSLPWVLALLLTSTVAADSTPSAALGSASAAVPTC